MADKCIGKLTLDISDVEKKVNAINQALAGIGKNASIKIKIAEEVKSQIDKIYQELENGSKKISETASKAVESIKKIGEAKIDSTKQEASIQKTLALYEKLYNARNRLYELEQKGQQNTVAYAKATADIEKYERALSKISETTRQAAQSRKEYEAILDKSVAVKNAAKVTEEAKEVEKATQAYIKLLDAKSKVKQLETEGKQDTQEYLKATQAAGKAYDAFIKYSQGAREAAKASQEAAQARRDLNAVEEKVAEDTSKIDYLAQIKQQYFEITDAVKNYNAAKKAGDNAGMADAQARIDAAMQEVNAIQEAVNASNLEASAKQQVLNYIQQCVTAEHQHGVEANQTAQKTGELEAQVNGLVTRYLSLMAVIRAISSLMNNMVEYVSEYSDKMNEIQMITLKTDAEIANLADTYRSLAADMNVSSLDMADAAIYFTRQGLEAAEIEKRLKNVTMYAKAANVEFKDASEIITAVVNSMGLVEQEAEDGRNAAQRVADVFLQIGDHAATSGQEIGEAMQKAAASAGAFGVSMEWLAAYIATVSETTRQEARTIGTAFNTIIARLHQIKSTGYNQEDETKVNDIAKALSKIDIVLMDQEGNWRDMEDILVEVAEKWGDLDGKTKSYIATTMAGVKQQNVFLALMNDMSKGADEGSRAFELHAIAMESDGVAAEKYGVYLDSVTAAQERLTIAQENFYAILSQDVIKGWYDALAGIVNWITGATEALGGLNIIIPVVAGAVYLLVVAFGKLAAAATAAGGAMALLSAHPIILAITAVVAGITALTGVASLFRDTSDDLVAAFNRANDALAESQKNMQRYKEAQEDVIDMFADFRRKQNITSEDLEAYNGLLDDLCGISPIAKTVVEQLKEGFISQEEAAKQLNDELERLIRNEKEVSLNSLMDRYASYAGSNSKNKDTSAILSWMNYGENYINGYSERDPKWQFVYSLKNASFQHDFSEELQESIEEMLEEYLDMDMEEDEAWEKIAERVAYKLFGDFEIPDDLTKTMAQEINDEIDYAISTIGDDIDPVKLMEARRSLYNRIFGEDGELSPEEYDKFAQNIFSWLKDFKKNGLDSMIEEVSDIDVAEMLADYLFGPNVVGDLFQYAETRSEEFSKDFVRSYSELVKMGFTKDEIKAIFDDIPQTYWNEAIDILRDQLNTALQNEFGGESLGVLTQIISDDWDPENPGANIETVFDSLLWNDIDLKTIQTILDMAREGIITLDDVNNMMLESEGSVDAFKQSLEDYGKTVGFVVEEAEDSDDMFPKPQTISQIMKGLKDTIADIKEMESVIKTLEGGKTVKFDDILDLVGAHPELMTVINDTELLKEKLKEIRDQTKTEAVGTVMDFILGDSEFMKSSKYSDFVTDDIKTLNQYIATLDEESDAYKEVMVYVDELKQKLVELTNSEEEETKAQQKSLKEMGEEVKGARQELDKLDSMIDKLGSGSAIKFEDLLDLTMAHPEIAEAIGDSEKLLETLRLIREESKETFGEKLSEMLWSSPEWAASAAKTQGYDLAEGETLKEYKERLEQEGASTESLVAFVNAAIDALKLAREELDASTETWLSSQAAQIEQQKELNYAKATGYEEQINVLQEALGEGGSEGAQKALAVWDSFDAKMKESIADTYPGIITAMDRMNKELDNTTDNTDSLNKATEDLNRELSKSEKYATAKYFKDAYSSIQDLENGTISATEAYDTFDKELNKVTKAYEDILDVQAKMAYNAKEVNKDNQQAIDAGDVSNLATVLGMTTDEILSDFPAAVDMFNELTGAAGELETVLNMLNDAAFIKITGTSDADFSAIESGLIYVQNLADEAVEKLLATGQWELDEIQMNQTAALWNWDNNEKTAGHWSYPSTIVGAQVLKPTGKNPFKGSSTVTHKADTKQKSSSGKSGGSGGGSGEHNTKKTETEVERMLDLMSQINAINQAQQNFYQAQQKYYSQTGQIQGVIAYMQKEREELESQKPLLEGNIKEIERYMAQKKAELAALSTSDEAYAEVADDLDKLQKAHQNYTKQLIDNSTAIEALNEQMDEQRKKIRQMEIDLRNTVLKAIEDREKKKEDMLNAEIQMENKIFDLIKRRYERERDEILRITDMKIDALQQERDLLSEQLELRKKQEETEDKVAKLKALEVKYQRIIADPTRAKEAQKIRTEIDELRKEMAWDAAEEEVKSQQDALDQQITSLDDYKNYIEEFYEDLFEHPQKLIEEMRTIIMGTQQEIINWLKANDEEYQNSSANTQLSMVNGWNQTYNDMKGILTQYWEEVEYIISQGDDYIIEFLKNNSADYAAAGKLQAEAYVDEWKKQLSDLKKAHEQVAAEIAAEYEAIAKSTYVAPSGGGGGRSGGGATEDHGYSFTYGGKEYKASGFTSKEAANSAMRDAVYNILRVGAGTMASSSMIGQGIRAVQDAATVYAKGGIADFTGPAWLDGSPQDPERILSPYQTKLFETMISALENIDRVMIPSMSNYSNLQATGGGNVSVGDIVVNVDNLDTEDDYEEMADKVCAILMDRIGQTTAIGGLRIRSV